MPSNPISLPSGYAPAFAIGYASESGDLSIVHADAPLPMRAVQASAPAPLAGSTASATVAGPFTPAAGRTVMISLSGTWTGSVQLERSIDGGATRHPVTVGGVAWGQYSSNACEPVWQEDEAGAELYLALAPASGTVTYRLAQ